MQQLGLRLVAKYWRPCTLVLVGRLLCRKLRQPEVTLIKGLRLERVLQLVCQIGHDRCRVMYQILFVNVIRTYAKKVVTKVVSII